MLFVEEIIDIKFQRIQGIFQCGRLRGKKLFKLQFLIEKKSLSSSEVSTYEECEYLFILPRLSIVQKS